METHQDHTHKTLRFVLMALLLLILLVLQGPCAISTASENNSQTIRYTIDPKQGKFITHAFAGGLLWFQGHDHYLAARDFSGEVEANPQTVVPASLRLVVKAGSLEETGDDFTDQQKQIINKEVHDIVLLPDKYPDIVFESTGVTAKQVKPGEFDVNITGNLTLLGVTRRETFPVKVHLSENDLQAVGQFTIDRGDYKVKATSAAHGLISVKDKVRFEFDIVAHRK